MLPIVTKMKRLEEEARIAYSMISDVLETLRNLKEGDNLTDKVGLYLRGQELAKIKFVILKDDVEKGKNRLRMVCSGELAPANACQECEQALSELQQIQVAAHTVTLKPNPMNLK